MQSCVQEKTYDKYPCSADLGSSGRVVRMVTETFDLMAEGSSKGVLLTRAAWKVMRNVRSALASASNPTNALLELFLEGAVAVNATETGAPAARMSG